MTSILYLMFAWSLCCLVGYGTASILLPSNWQRDRLFLMPVTGAGVLILLSSFCSYSGLPMLPAARSILVAGLALSAIGLAISGRRRKSVRGTWHAALLVHALGFIGGASALASVVLYHAWNPYTDAFTYISIADFLQGHSYFTRAVPGSTQPVLTQMLLYQNNGFRMGSNFLLAFFTALFREDYSFDVYLPVLSLALWIAVPGFWVLCRRALFMPFLASTMATAIYALHSAIPIANSLWGFMPETWGFVFMLPFLALYMRVQSAGERIGRVVAAGFFGGLLLLTYTEIVPFVLLSVTVYAVVRLLRRLTRPAWAGPRFPPAVRQSLRFGFPVQALICCLGPFVVAAIVSPVAAWNFLPAILTQARGVVGWDVHLSALDYICMLPGYRSIVQNEIMSPGIAHVVLRLAAVIGAITAGVTAIRGPARNLRQVGWLAFPFIAGFAWFGLCVANPWDASRIGHPWSTYKLVTYSFYLFVALWGIGLATLWKKGSFYRLLSLAQLLSFLSFFPVATIETAKAAAVSMHQFTTNNGDPENEYKRIRAILDHLSPHGPVNLIVPSEAQKHRELVAYFLRHPIISDWSDDGYIGAYMDHSSRSGEIDPRYPLLVYEPIEKSATVAHLKLISSGVEFLSDSLGAGWWSEERDGQNWWRWLEEKGEVTLLVGGDGGWLTMKTDLAVVGAKQRTITIDIAEKPEDRRRYTLSERWFSPFTAERIYLEPGRYHIFISADGLPYRFPNDPRRAMRIGVRNLTWVPGPK